MFIGRDEWLGRSAGTSMVPVIKWTGFFTSNAQFYSLRFPVQSGVIYGDYSSDVVNVLFSSLVRSRCVCFWYGMLLRNWLLCIL